MKHGREGVGRRVEDRDAAGRQLLGDFRVEDQLEAVERRIRHQGLDLLGIDADPDGAPLIDDAVLVAGVRPLDLLHQCRIEVLQVRDLRLVELLESAGLDQAAHRGLGRRDGDVVAGAADQQLLLQDLEVVVDVVVVRNTAVRLEVLKGRFADIIVPVVNIDRLCRRQPRRTHGAGCGDRGNGAEQAAYDPLLHPTEPRPCRKFRKSAKLTRHLARTDGALPHRGLLHLWAWELSTAAHELLCKPYDFSDFAPASENEI